MIREITPPRHVCRHCRKPIVLIAGVWVVDLGGCLRETCRWTRSKTDRAHVPLEAAPAQTACHSGHVPPDTTSRMRRA